MRKQTTGRKRDEEEWMSKKNNDWYVHTKYMVKTHCIFFALAFTEFLTSIERQLFYSENFIHTYTMALCKWRGIIAYQNQHEKPHVSIVKNR